MVCMNHDSLQHVDHKTWIQLVWNTLTHVWLKLRNYCYVINWMGSINSQGSISIARWRQCIDHFRQDNGQRRSWKLRWFMCGDSCDPYKASSSHKQNWANAHLFSVLSLEWEVQVRLNLLPRPRIFHVMFQLVSILTNTYRDELGDDWISIFSLFITSPQLAFFRDLQVWQTRIFRVFLWIPSLF